MLRAAAFVFCLWAVVVPTAALGQTPTPSSTAQPPLRRWFEIQGFTLATRYRFQSNSKGDTTSNQLQYKDTFRARFNIDRARRFTVNIGFFSGSNFIGSWNNWGVGHGTTFDGKDNYLKQLFASAMPVAGLEVQYGGLYLNRGEADEFLSYDDDGYIAGERISLRRPADVWLDEISVTRAAIGPINTPSLTSRWDGLSHPNYTQVLLAKRFSGLVAGSAEYERRLGADVIRAAVTLHFRKPVPIGTLRYEQYRRMNQRPANGFGVWADRSLPRHLQLQGGYISVDQFYGGWNTDRMQSGRRIFVLGTIPIRGPVSAGVFATWAFHSPYTVGVARRLEAIVTYDVLNTLRRTGLF